MKFPVGIQVGEVLGDQKASKRSYVQLVKEGEARKRGIHEGTEANRCSEPEEKRVKKAEVAAEASVEAQM